MRAAVGSVSPVPSADSTKRTVERVIVYILTVRFDPFILGTLSQSAPMLSLTPGLRLLFRLLLSLVIPAVVIFGVAHMIQRYFPYDVPNWALLFAWVAYLPVTIVFRSLYQWIQEERDIRLLGAVRIPQLKGWLPGNLDVAGQLMIADDVYMCKTYYLMP